MKLSKNLARRLLRLSIENTGPAPVARTIFWAVILIFGLLLLLRACPS